MRLTVIVDNNTYIDQYHLGVPALCYLIEDQGSTARNGVTSPDMLHEDSALVYEGSEGIFIITGCSHSGICNITAHAMEVCGCTKVTGIIGGFHLFEENAQTTETVTWLRTLDLPAIHPCHCTSFAVKAAINRHIPVVEVGVGLKLEIP